MEAFELPPVQLPPEELARRVEAAERQAAHTLGILFLVVERCGGEIVIPRHACAAERELPDGQVKYEFLDDRSMRVWWEPSGT